MRTTSKTCARRRLVHAAVDIDVLGRAREAGGWVVALCGIRRYVTAGSTTPPGMPVCPECGARSAQLKAEGRR
jgi:hypothetical protein